MKSVKLTFTTVTKAIYQFTVTKPNHWQGTDQTELTIAAHVFSDTFITSIDSLSAKFLSNAHLIFKPPGIIT